MSLLEQYEQRLSETASAPCTLLNQVEATLRPSGLNMAAYQDYTAHNRPHQIQALDSLNQNNKGQIIIPTGTGKTRIQVSYLVGDMIAKSNANTTGVYVIASHRLLLNKQLMDEYQDLCIKTGLPVNVLYVGSARQDDKAVYEKYFLEGINSETFKSKYTTFSPEIKAFYDETLAANRHLIIVSTYHSFHKLSVIDTINVCCYDEAHNTTNEEFKANIEEVLPKIAKNFFFTATRKVCIISGHGMENQEIYGDVLCEISPRVMINQREIVTPRIIAMMLDTDTPKGIVSDKNQHMLVKTICEGFLKNQELVRQHSSNPTAIGTKLLVSFVGSDELSLVQESEEFKSWCEANHVRVFSVSSKYGSYMDFETEARNRVYGELKSLRDEEDCILLHIDILAEGIDLPSITGVLPLRHLNEIKLFQTFGRALRLMKTDRRGLYEANATTFIKPYAYLILPMHFTGMDTSSEDMRVTIQSIISTYGIPVEEFLPPEGFKTRDIKALDPVTDHKHIVKTKKDYPLLSVVEEFVLDNFVTGMPEDLQARYDRLLTILDE